MLYLRNWSVGNLVSSPFAAPEMGIFALQGDVFGHSKYADGTSITTSQIKKVEGNVVTTSSGSRYMLEKADDAFLEFLKEKGVIFNPKDPLNFKK